MSANLIVDLGGTCQISNTISSLGAGSGLSYAASGAIVGQVVDLINANTYCNVLIAGNAAFASGQLRIAVQTSDTNTSGTFTDPTSGLPAGAFPTWIQSGGIFILNSGGLGGGLINNFVSGQSIQSGYAVAGAFLRNARYARAIMLSGDFYAGDLSVNFISQLKTTGSGGGFTFSPASGNTVVV